MTLPSLPPELMFPVVIAPPLAWALAAGPPFPAAALPPALRATRPTGRGVVVATIGIGRRCAAIGTDVDRRLVGDRAAVDRDVPALAALDRDLVARVATGVDVADADGAAVGIGRRGTAVPGCRIATGAIGATGPPVAVLLLPPLALAVAVPPSALMATVVALLTLPPLMRTLAAPPNKPLEPTTIRLPLLPPELMLPTLMVPPLAWAVAGPPFPAAALPPLPAAPPAPPVAVLLLPPLALAVPMPPSALRLTVVALETVPPLTATVRGP